MTDHNEHPSIEDHKKRQRVIERLRKIHALTL